MTQPFSELDAIVLVHDLPDAGLCAGALGTVVHVHAPDVVEVEFVVASGSAAIRTLRGGDIRIASDEEVLAARPLDERD